MSIFAWVILEVGAFLGTKPLASMLPLPYGMGFLEWDRTTPCPTLAVNTLPEETLVQLQLGQPSLPSSLPTQTGPAFTSG